jgi:transitional endoplasmic reticulum ATPase
MNAHADIELEAGQIGPSNSLVQWLMPNQRAAFEKVAALLPATNVIQITGGAGTGKTILMKAIAEYYNIEFIDLSSAVDNIFQRSMDDPMEASLLAIEEALERNEMIVLDEFDRFFSVGSQMRGGLHSVFLGALFQKIYDMGKRIVLVGAEAGAEGATVNHIGSPNRIQAVVQIEALEAVDYATFVSNWIGEDKASGIDFDVVFRRASLLNGHELRVAAQLLSQDGKCSTDDFVSILERNIIKSNARIEEVETLSFSSLPGTEHMVAKLETHVILPLENPELSRDLDLKPKRGVLLYGPPGSGKTSIGRALAHRMKGRFFLIDGSFTTEPPIAFFAAVKRVVQAAKEGAPCVLFIDDADVLFEIEHIAGFARYLLSFLDGLESAGAEKVCLMMTAMDARKIPSSILRSGRVELWLETRRPDRNVRAAILRRWLSDRWADMDEADLLMAADAANNFNPADLRRVIADAQSLDAMDKIMNKRQQIPREYLLSAIRELIETRAAMADNLNDDSLRLGSIMPPAKYGLGIGGLVESKSACVASQW